jgi:hypothetical protein
MKEGRKEGRAMKEEGRKGYEGRKGVDFSGQDLVRRVANGITNFLVQLAGLHVVPKVRGMSGKEEKKHRRDGRNLKDGRNKRGK